jgi:Protein of unknown function (DUF2911)
MRTLKRFFIALTGVVGLLSAQSPATETSGTIAGASLTIKYSSPSVRGRQIFGDGGVVSRDSTYPVWRAGANAATTLQTGADLDIAGLKVPAGTYTLYVLVKDPEKWKLIIDKQTGQNGDSYDPSMDLGPRRHENGEATSAHRKAEVYDHSQRQHRQTPTGMGE